MKDVYEIIGISRYCCKRTVLASYDTSTYSTVMDTKDEPVICSSSYEDDIGSSGMVRTEPSIPEGVRVETTSNKTNFLKVT